jgi:dienelactone hydrolase
MVQPMFRRVINQPDPLADFEAGEHSSDGATRRVYWLGRGPGVVLIHELPGITPECARLARRLAAEGFRVAMPSLFGEPGKPFSLRYVASMTARICVAGEFAALESGKSGTATPWLRSLARSLHAECGGPGVGVIGMCFTGHFAIAMMADASVIAPVTSQPSLPLHDAHDLHVSPDELVAIRKSRTPLLGLRFSDDAMCRRARFDRLRAELGDRFEAVEIDSSRTNPHGLGRTAHSVITIDLVAGDHHPTQAALARVLSFLRERLAAPPPAPPRPDR